jgi:hypothetical protein
MKCRMASWARTRRRTAKLTRFFNGPLGGLVGVRRAYLITPGVWLFIRYPRTLSKGGWVR